MRVPLAPLVLFLLLVAIVIYAGYNPKTDNSTVRPTRVITPIATPTPVPVFIDEDKVWDAVQAWRIKEGKTPYKKSEVICKYALERANQIQTDYSHNQFSPMSDRLYNEAGYKYVAENLSEGVLYPHLLVEMWEWSPTHRKNLDFNYTDSCIKCVNNFCAQVFASY